MTADRPFYIYCHTSPSGKRYIGQTCQSPNLRWSHGHGYRGQPYFSRAIAKYGWDNFDHQILCVVHSKKMADLFEQHYIAKYDTFDGNHGYNLTKGGGGCLGHKPSDAERAALSDRMRGREVSDESRRKISESLKEGYRTGRITPPTHSEEALKRMSEERKGEGNPMYGRHHTPEAIASMTEKRTGMKRSEEARRNISEARYKSEKIKRRQVDQFDLDGNYIATYASIKEAADTVGDFTSCIGSCCRGKMRRSKQYRWRYHEDTVFAFEAIREGRLSA